MHYDQSNLRDCALKNNDCRALINKELEAPSPHVVVDLVRRAFSRELNTAVAVNRKPVAGTIKGTSTLQFEDTSVITARLVCTTLDEHKAELSAALVQGNSGDIIILESLDLSKGHCFPYYSALGRFQEILSQYQQAVGHPVTNDELSALTVNGSLGSIILMGAPIRLLGRQKALPAMILEGIAPCLLEAGMITSEEFETVTAELRRIGRDQTVSMSSFTINRILYAI